MKKIFSLLFFSLALISCKKDVGCLNFPLEKPSELFNNHVKLDYKDGKLVKRSGIHTGLVFNKDLYDELTYRDKLIEIIRKDNSEEYDIAPYSEIITLDEKDRMIKKTIRGDATDPEKITRTIEYSYNSEDQIISSTASTLSAQEMSEYFYNQQGNLDSIVTNRNNEGNWVKYKIEKFYDYNDKLNPIKNLVIFDDTFQQALSKNNFTAYEKIDFTFSIEHPYVEQTRCSFE
jgi:hypothetical protein